MRHPSLAFASLTAATALLLGGCTSATTTDDESVTTPDAAVAVIQAASVNGLDEVSLEDLDIADGDTDPDLSQAVAVSLADGASSGDGVVIDGDTVTITSAGTYVLTGTLTAGRVVVDAPDADVTLVLDGVDITSPDTAALLVDNADHVSVVLAAGSTNTLADAPDAVESAEEDAPNATLYATSDLWISGDGSLTVTGVAVDGITSKDSLVIVGGTLSVTAADDAIRGKDHLVVLGGDLTLVAGGDGLSADDEGDADDPDRPVGVMWLAGGTIDIEAGDDGAQAFRQLTVAGSTVTISAADDGLKSDGFLRVADGEVVVTESYEGIEAAFVNLSGGTADVTASDDALNIAGGEAIGYDGVAASAGEGGGMPGDMPADAPAGMEPPAGLEPPVGGADPGMTGDRPERPSAGEFGPVGQTGAGPGGAGGGMGEVSVADDLSAVTASALTGSHGGPPAQEGDGSDLRYLSISGGDFVFNGSSDGIDVNGWMIMTGGSVTVTGTEQNMNSATDVDGTFTIEGGTLVAAGSAGMQAAPTGEGQGVLAVQFSAGLPAGTTIVVADANGQAVTSYTTIKVSQAFVLSSDDLTSAEVYTVSIDGHVAGEVSAQ